MRQPRNGPGGRIERSVLVSAAEPSGSLLRQTHGSAVREVKRMVAAGLLALDGTGAEARVSLTEAGKAALFGTREVMP